MAGGAVRAAAVAPGYASRIPRSRLLALAAPVALVAAAASCGKTESPHRVTGERLWREAVWNLDTRTFAEALPHLERALEDAGDHPDRELLFLFGSALLFDGHSDVAAGYVDALRVGPPAPEPLLLDGWELALVHARPDAELAFGVCLDRTSAEHPFADEIAYLAFFWRGEERFFHGDWGGAVEDLTAAREILLRQDATPNRRLVRALAEAHRYRREFGPAEAVMRDAAVRDPSYAPFAFDLALLLAAQAKPDEARQWFLTAVDRDPRFPPPYLKLSCLAWEQGELDHMRRHLDRYAELTDAAAMTGRSPQTRFMTAEIASGMGLYWTERAKLHVADGDEDQAAIAYGLAKDSYQRALELNPSCHRALYRLIQLGALSGEPEEVLDEWKRAIERIEQREGIVPDAPAASEVGRTFC